MMKADRLFTLMLGVGLLSMSLVWISSCSNSDNEKSTNVDGVPTLLSVSPSEGATDVDRNGGIHMRFSMPMDTASVRRNFHLAGGPEMENWMGSLSHHQGMMGGGMMNMDHMMDWMDTLQYSGQLHWNSTMDSCEFEPDSSMMPNTNHMIYMYDGLRAGNGKMMDMNSLPYDGIMHHFRTKP